MPCIIAPTVKKTVTITADSIAVDSTTDIWPGQLGNISASGVATRRIKVVDVLSATTFRAKYEPRIGDDNFMKNSVSGASDAGYPSSAAANDLSAYTTGSVLFDQQLVSTQPDYTKPRA